MSDSKDTPPFPNGVRLVLTGRDRHVKNGQPCMTLRALPNPSGRAENQWYDVRFDDNTLGRFAGRYLAPANTDQTQRQATSPAA